MKDKNNRIDYIELKAVELNAVKAFYSTVFDWKFTDYGPTYSSFENSGVYGGFELSDEPIVNGALVILYHENLEEVQQKVIQSGGEISKAIFSFPGGRRFHFLDPSGNELAVWSE
jgi:predicted enzyme related to lactoylglutathione lyase